MDPGTALAVGQVSGSVLKIIWKYYGDVKDAKSDIQSLANELKDFQNVALEVQKLLQKRGANADLPTSSDLTQTLKQSLLDVQDLELKLDPGTGDKLMKRVGRRALKWPFTKMEVVEWVSKLQRFKSTLNLALNADMASLVVDMRDSQLNSEQERLLERLPMASEASFNSYHRQYEPKCMVDTRVELLRHLQDWGTNHRQPIFWLKGMAGTGKSTISRTLAEVFDEQNLLGGSFFFSRSSGEANNAAQFVGTVANQLASLKPQLRHCICEAISTNSDALRQGLRNQWEAFISGPLSNAKFLQRPTLNVVIDALDECASDDDIRLLLQLFVETQSINNVDLGIFVTSRPETTIRFGFNKIPKIIHYDLDLHNIPHEIIQHDISVYLRQELTSIRLERSLDNWPSEADLQALVLRAGSLFIYAAAACRFIRDKCWDPVERLSSILGNEAADDGSTTQLDNMYRQVLQVSLIEGRTDGEVAKLCDRFKLVVGSIIVLFDELSISNLANLLILGDKSVEACLNSLHSVLNISQDLQSPIRLLHPSFRDFLLDERRCGDRRFFQEEAGIHEKLARSCLGVISTSLRQNICHLPTPGSPPHDVSKETLSSKLPKHVQYACNYWAEHLSCTEKNSTTRFFDNGAIHFFFQNSFLNWLEAMSLMGRMTQAVLSIIALSQLTEVSAHTRTDSMDILNVHLQAMRSDENIADRARNLMLLVEDAKRFILSHRGMVEKAPLELYSSALVFSPSGSIIRKIYSASVPTWLQKSPNVPQNWDNCEQILENPGRPLSIALSHDGKYLACGLNDGTVCLWDPATGALHSTLHALSYREITSVAFSPDGILAIAAVNGRIQLLDPVTGRTLHEKNLWTLLRQRANSLSIPEDLRFMHLDISLAFLPNDKLVIGYHEWEVYREVYREVHREVYIWDRKRDELSERLYPESLRYVFRGCSPKGKLLLECPRKEDGMTEYLIYDTTAATSQGFKVTGYHHACCAAAISDKYVALAFPTGDLKLLNLVTQLQDEYRSSTERKQISTLEFSPDSCFLGIGDNAGLIESLDLQTRQSKVIENCGLSNVITSMAWSSDGGTLASICERAKGIQIWKDVADYKTTSEDDDLLRVKTPSWDTSISLSPTMDLKAINDPTIQDESIILHDTANGDLALLLRHKSIVTEFVFSTDNRLLAAACKNRSMSIWNLQRNVTTKAATCEQVIVDVGDDTRIAFSPDSSQLAFICDGEEVQIWSTVDGSRPYCLQILGVARQNRILDLVYSPNGKLIAFWSVGLIMIFETRDGDLLHSISIEASKPSRAAFSPDGKLFAYITDRSAIIIYNLETDREVKTIFIEDQFTGEICTRVVFSPDGKSLAYSALSGIVYILNIDTAQVIDSLKTARFASAVQFYKDGRYLDTNSGRFRISQPNDHLTRVSSIARSCWRIDDEWVYEGDQKMLWLPPGYRPGKTAHRDGFFVIYTDSGRIISMKFSEEPVLAEGD